MVEYKDAIEHTTLVDDLEDAEIAKMKVTIFQNMSVCTNNMEDYKATVLNTTKAIKIDENATKAYYLRSVAHYKLNDSDKALADIKSAIKLSPQDTNLRAHLEAIKKMRAIED